MIPSARLRAPGWRRWILAWLRPRPATAVPVHLCNEPTCWWSRQSRALLSVGATEDDVVEAVRRIRAAERQLRSRP